MKKSSLSDYTHRLRILRAMEMLKTCKGAAVSEGANWWICQKWFGTENGEKTEKSYLIHAKGATPAKAARNFLKILPRRLRSEIL